MRRRARGSDRGSAGILIRSACLPEIFLFSQARKAGGIPRKFARMAPLFIDAFFEDCMSKTVLWRAAPFFVALLCFGFQTAASADDKVVRVGVLTDMSGFYS